MRDHILILAGRDDVHADAVEKELNAKGAAFVRVDRAELVADGMTVTAESVTIGPVDLDRTSVIWCRRLPRMNLPPDMPRMWRRWCSQEFAHAMLGALMRQQVAWISDYFAMQRANHKTLQLSLADSIGGLGVPEYVITSDAAKARAFVESCQGQAVFKPLGPPALSDEETLATLYTNAAERIAPYDWRGLKFAPMIFQRRIDRVAEVRATVVGERIFAARIDVTAVEDADYRTVDPYRLPHESIALPDEVAAGCLALSRAFELSFAAVDLLLDREGRFHFLEINPNGQWYWIEDLTGLPIARAVSEELIKLAVKS